MRVEDEAKLKAAIQFYASSQALEFEIPWRNTTPREWIGPFVGMSSLLSVVWVRIFLVDVVTFRQHTLMEDARYQNAVGCEPVEQNVPSMFNAV